MFETTAVVEVLDDNCVGCKRCINVCPSDALAMQGRLAVVDQPSCVGCFKCIEACGPYKAIKPIADPEPRVLTIAPEDRDEVAAEELCHAARLAPDQIVCVCTSTTAVEIAAAVVSGISEPEQLTLATGVRSKCGMWCLTPTMRLLAANGVETERSDKDHRLYPDGSGVAVGIWSISEEIADKYPEYRLRQSQAAVEDGTSLNSPTPWFPDVLSAATSNGSVE